jgi:thiamine biosynthesis protein ThiS
MICVNQEGMNWEPGLTVQDVLDRRKYTFPMIIVKVDGEIVPKQEYSAHQIEDGAEVQVIHLISGGE